MYYDTVEIRPFGRKWIASHQQVDGDRQSSKKYTPHAMGFFHYPRKWGVQKGFLLLKEAMIKRHEDQIAALTESLSGLRKVQPPGRKALP